MKFYGVFRVINYEGDDLVFLSDSLEKATEVFNNPPANGDRYQIREIELNKIYDLVNYFPQLVKF